MKLIHQRCGNIEDYGEFHGNLQSQQTKEIHPWEETKEQNNITTRKTTFLLRMIIIYTRNSKFQTDLDCHKKQKTNILSPRVIDVPDAQKKICKYKTDPDCRKKLETNISLCVIDAPDVQKKICK
jgi:hypothetical protein